MRNRNFLGDQKRFWWWEDDEAFCAIWRAAVLDAGYPPVVEAGNGGKPAWYVKAAKSQEIDLLPRDMIMPGKSGF